MPLTLGMTGMDPATEAALKAAFEDANARVGTQWQLASESDADFVLVDMDSMYGPMSWLRLHAAGKRVIGLSSASRTQTDYHLLRPFDAAALTALLEKVAGDVPASPAGMAPSPEPRDALPEERPMPPDEEAAAPGEPAGGEPGSAQAGTLEPATVEPPAPPRERRLGDWCAAGALEGKVRFAREGGPELFIDPASRTWFGPTALKPMAGYFEDPLTESDFEPVADADWDARTGALGAAQPLSRLQWFGGLVAGKGALLPGHDPDGRYKLAKWPQTEREYPKHFRIATAMMKAPATLPEIAEASGVPLPEVVDFVNANLATGYAELVPETPPEPEQPARGGLFGRRRK